MQITFYLDIIFFINFIADFVVLLITGVILKQKIVLWRLLTGASFGAGMLLPLVCFPHLLMGKTGIAACVGISMGAVAISFGRKNGGIIKKWFLSTTIMFLLGGIMSYFKQVTDNTFIQLSVWMILFTGSSLCGLGMIYFWKRVICKRDNMYLIKVKHEDRIAVDQVYLDTGNMLWDPLFYKPVIMLSEKFVGRCITKEEEEIVREYREKGRLDFEKTLACKTLRKACFHEITYQSVGNPSGKLLCFLVEEIHIGGSDHVLKKQPVAIGPSFLFEGKEYQGLLHRECI